MTAFRDFLQQRLQAGGFSTEDALVTFLPLVRDVLALHAAGGVAPLEGIEHIVAAAPALRLTVAEPQPPWRNDPMIRMLEAKVSPPAVEIIGQVRLVDGANGPVAREELPVQPRRDTITRPTYLPGYVTWEQAVDHHDPVTDVFSLGMILASLCCGLDFHQYGDLEKFVRARRNLFEIAPSLHPVLAKAILRMTELDRSKRPQDLRALLHSLENYRDQAVDIDFDLARMPGFRDAPPRDRRRRVLSALQKRLFELNRRNRLLHFRPTQQTVNLTWGSVPLSFDIENIRPNEILTWNATVQKSLASGKPFPLARHLRFDEALYLAGSLERIRAEARRDQAEFGFASLRLVLCFLRWSNLKETPHERYDSPLALLPVDLVRKKGVRDAWQLVARTTEAEINPVLRHCFRQWYGVNLPEAIDLDETPLESLHGFLLAHIQASEPAVTIEKIAKPRIHVIHAEAQRRMEQFSRRGGGQSRDAEDETRDHAEHATNGTASEAPLSDAVVEPAVAEIPQEAAVSIAEATELSANQTVGAPAPSPIPATRKTRKKKGAVASPESPAAGPPDPYAWELDLCSLTLGTFRYRKMSLVRDYEALLEQAEAHPAFDAVFSLAPKPAGLEAPPAPTLDERWPVVPCDPTQTAAVAYAATGRSYIIQGPPGTGKSQSITNLIADFAVRGKRVLFVCEKRAAIDVVFHRLKQRGLASLCCLIHDSQADKKDFILDLKETYESLLAEDASGENVEASRGELLTSMHAALAPLEKFDEAMRTTHESLGTSARALLVRTLETPAADATLTPVEQERLPAYRGWNSHAEQIARLRDAIDDVTDDGVLARHPLAILAGSLAGRLRPIEFLKKRIDEAFDLLDGIETHWPSGSSGDVATLPLDQLRTIAAQATLLRDWAAAGRVALLTPESAQSQDFAKAMRRRQRLADAVDQARTAAAAWRVDLPAGDLMAALESARAFERDPFKWLKPGFWRLRGLLDRSYDYTAHPVRRSIRQALSELDALHTAQAVLDTDDDATREQFAFEGDVDRFADFLDAQRQATKSWPPAVQAVCGPLLNPDGNAALLAFSEIGPRFDELAARLDEMLHESTSLTLSQIDEALGQIEDALERLPAFLPCLTELAELPDDLASALRTLPMTLEQLEAAAARRALDDFARDHRPFGKFSGKTRAKHVKTLGEAYDRIFELNAAVVRRRLRERFLEHVRLSQAAAGGLSPEDKELKTRYSAGRKDLEHEFGKTMRWKSIRDLVSGETGLVVQDLKPVWLMSPLSVSDTLPLDMGHVDVVIFDEASQITVEEAIPSAFRAPQMIVVGDEMQLPPTSFFASRGADEEIDEPPAVGSSAFRRPSASTDSLPPSRGQGIGDETANGVEGSAPREGAEENGEPVEAPDRLKAERQTEVLANELDADSFLTHAARNIPSAMLGWHYRSRSESLISFSNAVFYHGRLLTVPEEERIAARRGEIVAETAADGERNVESLLDRPLSFHLLRRAVYEDRRNPDEADYIAHMVKGILARNAAGGKPRSIGIIAFSQAQQEEIERALERLSEADAEFSDRLDAEWERETDGQFVGLIVKNLENIQGDERDIVILSVCYAPDAAGKMRMNFGPINQSGGEKRLNVAFSRAKLQMAIVTTIRHQQITNEYNTGANCLKNYLKYAEAASAGDTQTARRVLTEINPRPAASAEAAARDPVAAQIAAALRERGYGVDENVGQSHFRCDLAVYREGDARYRLAVLVDTEAHYAQADILERDVLRPRLLEGFGWNLAHVLTKDWQSDRDGVLRELERKLGR